MSENRKALVKNVFLEANFDLFVDIVYLDNNENYKLQYKKEDFTYPPGSSVTEEMQKLKAIFETFIGKTMNINILADDALYYTKKGEDVFDLDKEMLDRRSFDDIEESFDYSDQS